MENNNKVMTEPTHWMYWLGIHFIGYTLSFWIGVELDLWTTEVSKIYAAIIHFATYFSIASLLRITYVYRYINFWKDKK